MDKAAKDRRDEEIKAATDLMHANEWIWADRTEIYRHKIAASLVYNLDKPYSQLTKYDHFLSKTQLVHLRSIAAEIKAARSENF